MGKSHSLDFGSSNRLLSTFPCIFPSSLSVVDSQAGLCPAMGLFGRGIAAGGLRVGRVPFQCGFGPGRA